MNWILFAVEHSRQVLYDMPCFPDYGLTMNGLQAYETLNRVQSIVYPIAYGTNENMLVCAPTGAVRYL